MFLKTDRVLCKLNFPFHLKSKTNLVTLRKCNSNLQYYKISLLSQLLLKSKSLLSREMKINFRPFLMINCLSVSRADLFDEMRTFLVGRTTNWIKPLAVSHNVRYCTFSQLPHFFSSFLFSPRYSSSTDATSILYSCSFSSTSNLSMRLSDYFNAIKLVDCLLLAMASTSRRIFHRIRLLELFNFPDLSVCLANSPRPRRRILWLHLFIQKSI